MKIIQFILALALLMFFSLKLSYKYGYNDARNQALTVMSRCSYLIDKKSDPYADCIFENFPKEPK